MIKGWLSSCLKRRSKMLLCGLWSFLVKSWDLCYPYYPGRKSICCMVHGGKKTPHFPYFPVLQMRSMSGSMFYCFHSQPWKSPQALCLFPAMCYCAAGPNAVQGEAATLVGCLSLFSPEDLTWKVSINLFIRFGIQLALSFEVSASLKTGVCLFMFFLWLEKFLAGFSQALGEIFQKPPARYSYICLNLLVCWFVWFFFQEETDNDFCIQQDTAWGPGYGAFPPIFIPTKYIFLHL